MVDLVVAAGQVDQQVVDQLQVVEQLQLVGYQTLLLAT